MEAELIQHPEVNQEVKALSLTVGDLASEAKSIVIKDDETDAFAKDLLIRAATARKKAEELRKQFTKPLNDHVSDINAFFKNQAAPAVEAEQTLKGKVGDYFRTKQAAAQKELERQMALAAKRQETADKKAQANGQVAAPPVVVPMPAAVEKTTKSDTGSVTVKTVLKARVVDENLVPQEFGGVILRPVDMTAVNKLVKAGIRNIPGVQVYEENELAVR
jgi:hypothetical protein